MKRSAIYGDSYTEQKPDKPVNEGVVRIDEQKKNKQRIKQLGATIREERKTNAALTRRLREAESERTRLQEHISKLKSDLQKIKLHR